MSIKAILLILTFIINTLLGWYIISKSQKNKVNIYYGWLCLSAGFWALGMSLIHFSFNEEFLNDVILKLIYVSALLILLFYLLFADQFPYPQKSFLSKFYRFIVLITVILISLVLLGILKMENFKIVETGILETSLFPDYLILAVYYLLYVLSGLAVLINKYYKLTGVIKVHLSFVILATLIAFTFSLFVSLILPFFNNFNFDWLGPIFTLFNFIFIGYFLFVKSSKTI